MEQQEIYECSEKVRDSFSSLLSDVFPNGDDVKKLTSDIENSNCKKYRFLQKISGHDKIICQSEEKIPVMDNLSIKQIRNFNVPISIDKSLNPKNKKKDPITIRIRKPKTCIDAICEKIQHASELDVIGAGLEMKLLSPDQEEKLVESLDYRVQKSIPQFYSFISNRLANGELENESFQSYRKKSYPLGIPCCTGCDKGTRSILNLFYVAVEQKTSSNGRPTIIQQVSNDLEDVEDTHAACDVAIARNENVRRHLIEYGFDYVHTEPDMWVEMEECFGEKGELILKLQTVKEIQEVVQQFLLDTLYKRAKGLGMKRMACKPQWSKDLERILPPTRAQFKRVNKYINDYDIFETIKTPITFKVENVAYLSMIMEKYFAKRLQALKPPTKEEVAIWREIVETTAKQLRLPADSESFTLTYGRAAQLTAGSLLCIAFEVIRDMTTITESGRKIPLEIGITEKQLAGADRVMDLAVDYVINKNKQSNDNIQEMAGLFRVVDINQVMDFIKALTLEIKTMKYCAINDRTEAPLLTATVHEGELNIKSLYGAEEIYINLERFRPLPRKERR